MTNIRTMGRQGSECLHVLQITDTHLYADTRGRLVGLNTDRTYSEVMERVLQESWPTDLVLATGDIVHDGSESGYRRFKAQFEDLAVRTLVIPGNHDDPQALSRVMQGGRVTYSEQALLGNWHFVMLDSVVPGQPGGHLRQAQLELLERSLSAHPDRHAMVCLHHHPVSVHSRWMDTIGVDNAADFWAVIDAHPQVRAVVWGHIHQDFHERRGDVELIATPSTCIQFKPGQEEFALDEAPPGYRWFRLHDDGRVETGVERLEQMPTDVDLECGGYK